MKTVWIILALIIIGAGMLFFIRAPTTTEQPNITITENITPGITYGDLVAINYVLSLENGTVVDTNNDELAKQYGITNYVKGPYTFVLGQSGKVVGFDEALLGMKEGDHREAFIEPSEKEITLGVNKTRIINRMIALPKKQSFPKESFETFFSKPPIIGDVVFSEKFAFKYQVTNLTNKSVIAEIVAKEGEEYVLPNTEWKSSVVKIAEDDIMFYQQPEENQTLETPFGTATINLTKSRIIMTFHPELNRIFNKSLELAGGFGIPQAFQVTEIHDDYFVIKRHGALSDKRLKIAADLLSVVPGVKEVKQDKPLVTEVIGGTEN